MLSNSIANRLNSDSDWVALSSHIHEEVAVLNSIAGIDFLDKEQSAIEGRARQLAKEKLEKILEPFFMTEESTDDNKAHLASKTGVIL